MSGPTENKQSLADDECEVAIVGAGPSGLAAAALLREHGVDLTIIDEQPRAGGQLFHQYDGRELALPALNERSGIDWRLQSTVLGMMRPSPYRVQRGRNAPHELWVRGPDGCYLLRARAVLLATGCHDRPLAFPGWTLPGVMSATDIRGLLQSQQRMPGNRVLFAGSHPLQLVVAEQLLNAGVPVTAVVFTQQSQPARSLLRRSRQLFETAKIVSRLRRARVPVIFGKTIVRVDGGSEVQRATIATLSADGSIDRQQTQVFECDRVGIYHGFLASTELARQAGAEVHWHERAGGWLATHDEWFESSIANLFVAGEITGVDGADAAIEKGRIAAAGMLRALCRVGDHDANKWVESAKNRLSHLLRDATIFREFAGPPAGLDLQTMTGDTIVCPCESIKRGDLQRQLADNKHVMSTDAAKLLTRAGMGLCQGRMCGDNVARILAAERGVPLNMLAPFQAQAPVKPVPLAVLTRPRR